MIRLGFTSSYRDIVFRSPRLIREECLIRHSGAITIIRRVQAKELLRRIHSLWA